MENTYLSALHGMEGLFDNIEDLLKNFHRKEYAMAFSQFYKDHAAVLGALEQGYVNAIEKEMYLSNMADAVVSAATKYLEGFKKREIDNEKINLNLCMVAYIVPAILKNKGTSSEIFVDLLLDRWKEQFPESNLTAGTFEEIDAGFHRKWCYITTAVCQNSGKADDCYELTLLRDYRDGYLSSLEQGEELVREYYDVAPTIVKRINRMKEKESIYQGIYQDYIYPCITMIENGKLEECRDLYTKMVRDLQEEYFYTAN